MKGREPQPTLYLLLLGDCIRPVTLASYYPSPGKQEEDLTNIFVSPTNFLAKFAILSLSLTNHLYLLPRYLVHLLLLLEGKCFFPGEVKVMN